MSIVVCRVMIKVLAEKRTDKRKRKALESLNKNRKIKMEGDIGQEDIVTTGGNPTEVTNAYWIYVQNSFANNQKPSENCGKWLIFEPCSKIDSVWSLIKNETEMGRLGCSAKVSTKKLKGVKDEVHSSNYVICVYTYDHTDEKDAMRVRERLREIGFHKKLPYKTDTATRAGIYRNTTGTRVSKWYC